MTTRNEPPDPDDPDYLGEPYDPNNNRPAQPDNTAAYPVQPQGSGNSGIYRSQSSTPQYPSYQQPVYYVQPDVPRRSPLPIILGGVAALALVGVLLGFLFSNRTPTPAPPAATDTPTRPTQTAYPTDTALATWTPYIIVITATPGPPPATPIGSTGTPITSTPASITVTVGVSLTAGIGVSGTNGLPTVTPRPGLATVTTIVITPTAVLLAPTLEPTDTPSPTTAPIPTATSSPTPVLPAAVGTAGMADAAPVEPTEGYLTVQYFGQSTFYIVGGEGVRILIDPVAPKYGYRLPFFDGLDALLLSHWHDDHTFTQVAPGTATNFPGLTAAGKFNPTAADVKSAAVRSVGSYHDQDNGKELGENAMWVVDIDGFHIVHLGDLGQAELTDSQKSDIGRPDILMIPVGGGETIGGDQARQLVFDLKPKLVIPMHYRTDRTPADSDLEGLDKFLVQMGASDETPNSVRLKKTDLPLDEINVLVMSYKQ